MIRFQMVRFSKGQAIPLAIAMSRPFKNHTILNLDIFLVYIALEDPGSNPTEMHMVKCVNNRNAHVLAFRDWRKYVPLIYTGPATLLRYYPMTLWFAQVVSDFVNRRGKLVEIVPLLILLFEEGTTPKVS